MQGDPDSEGDMLNLTDTNYALLRPLYGLSDVFRVAATVTVTDVAITSTPEATSDTYGLDETIEVTLTFSEAVAVTGMPSVKLNVGGSSRTANYARRNPSNPAQLVFAYAVQSGDRDTDGIRICSMGVSGCTGEISLNGGTIKAVSDDSDVVLAHPAQDNQSGHKVDGSLSGPTVTGVAITSTPVAMSDTYGLGETIELTLTFSEAVAVAGTPSVKLNVGGSSRTANYARRNPTNPAQLVFAYAVQSGDRDTDGTRICSMGVSGCTGEISLNGGTIKAVSDDSDAVLAHPTQDNQSGHKVDGSLTPPAPTVSSVTLTSDPNDDGRTGDDDTYAIGDTVEATVTFSADVTVTGAPQIALDIGGTEKTAAYSSGTGTAALVFSYTVADGDEDTDGIAVKENQLSNNSNGDPLHAGSVDAILTHGAVAADSGHKVDGVRPIPTDAETSTDGLSITLTFSEPISSADPLRFILYANNVPQYGSITAADFNGNTVKLPISSAHALQPGQTVILSINAGAAKDAAGNSNPPDPTFSVTNNVVVPNTAPTFTSGPTTHTVTEAYDPANFFAYYEASDAENDTLMWTLEGDDAGDFALSTDNTNALKFRNAPNYESPADNNRDNIYNLTVKVTDDGSPAMSATRDVTITVTNVDEAGTVSIAGTPVVGTAYTATLSDPDEGVTGTTWQWTKSATATGTFNSINNATNAGYTPVTGDVGMFLKATASYTDAEGSGKSATSAASAAVAALPLVPTLRFGAASYTAREGGTGAAVTVELSPAASSSVTVPLTVTLLDGATAADYSGVSSSLTFAAGETSKTFTVTATDDSAEDPGERIRLGFGTLPTGVAAGGQSTTLVRLADDDATDVEGAFRLVDGDGDETDGGNGILEVFHNDRWGTVCDDRIENRGNLAPAMACRMMGYETGTFTGNRGMNLYPFTPFTGGNPPGANIISPPSGTDQPIWLDDLRCLAGSRARPGTPPGGPENISHCYHAGWGLHNCVRDEDVTLACTGTSGSQTEQAPLTPLTAAFEDLPSGHDGSSAFKLRLAFSEQVAALG